jgi:hypothetical protein
VSVMVPLGAVTINVGMTARQSNGSAAGCTGRRGAGRCSPPPGRTNWPLTDEIRIEIQPGFSFALGTGCRPRVVPRRAFGAPWLLDHGGLMVTPTSGWQGRRAP